jgi:thiopurine S-methyltransferase
MQGDREVDGRDNEGPHQGRKWTRIASGRAAKVRHHADISWKGWCDWIPLGRTTYHLCTMQLDRNYWEQRYTQAETGWDIGGPSTPLKEYIDGLKDRSVRILIPGAGRAYEAEYAHRLGFFNVFVLDLTDAPYRDLLDRCPDFPKEHLLVGDLLDHDGRYDIILEQTCFCALDPSLRERYVERMSAMLNDGGELVGVLFGEPLNTDHPPFGGDREMYLELFVSQFPEITLEPCRNSIPPRAGRELWLRAPKATYIPIDCSLYDHYEAAATLRQQVELRLVDGSSRTGRIVDLQVKDKVEWMRLEDGQEIRLDHIKDMRAAE